LNDRPLTYVSDDPKDPESLTPSHLLHGRRITSLPREQLAIDELSDPTYNEQTRLSKDAKAHNMLLQHFNARWRNEYITLLREYHCTSGNNECKISLGDVVLVHDDGPRIKCRLAVVEELIHGGDGLVRAANIRTSTGQTSRPVVRLIPLKVSAQDKSTSTKNKLDSEENSSDNSKDTPDGATDLHPIRDSARKA